MNAINQYQGHQQNHSASIKQNLTNHNGNPMIILNVDVCTDPICLLVDTGASISLIAEDLVQPGLAQNQSIRLYGISGKSTSVQTTGFVSAQTIMNNNKMDITLHTIDRKYVGPADGYLGFDFLHKYHSIIDLSNNTITLKFENTTPLYKHDEPKKNIKTIIKNILEEPYKLHNSIHGIEIIEMVRHVTDENSEIEETIITSNICEIRSMSSDYENLKVNSVDERLEIILSKLKLDHLGDEEKQSVIYLCRNYGFQFYVEGDILSCTDVLRHTIKLKPGSKPPYTKQYRIPQAHKAKLSEMISEYENQGLIQRCYSPFNAPLILVEKKDDMGGKTDMRLVIDFRKLNEITELENFPIPLIDEILEDMAGSEYFTLLDIKGAFHQIELDQTSKTYTAFTVGHIQYCWNRLPMGLTSAPLTWQRVINTILSDMIGKNVHAYLDDIAIFAKTRKKHDHTLNTVMGLLRRHNLQLKITKCIFYAKKFEYLGHMLSKHGISPNPKKIAAMRNYPTLTNIKMVQSFLGLCSYYRRYIRDFARIAKPLTRLCKTGTPFIWSEDAKRSFDELRNCITSDVILPFPDFAKLFYCTTDASDVAIGGVLSQGEIPDDRPIYFYSRTLSDTESRYSTIRKELLAIVESIRIFRPYLYGRTFVLITDHKPLVHLFNLRNCSAILYRMKLELMDYDFKKLYRPGAQNVVADCLSRTRIPLTINELMTNCATIQTDEKLISKTINKYHTHLTELREIILNPGKFDALYYLISKLDGILHTKLSKKFGNIGTGKLWIEMDSKFYIKILTTKRSTGINEQTMNDAIKFISTNTLKNQDNSIIIHTDIDDIRTYGMLKRFISESFSNSNTSIHLSRCGGIHITDENEKQKILKTYHESLLGGHTGVEKMTKTLKQFYNWENMIDDIQKHVSECGVCEKTKHGRRIKAPMEISSLGAALFDHTYIDFVGPLNITDKNNKYIFTACCDLTKFLVCVPTEDCSAKTSANCLLENIILRYNFPSRLISDNASNFTSKIILEINKLLKIAKIFTLPYKPQANIVERNHRTLNGYLRAFTSRGHQNWDDKLPFFAFAYNNAMHTTTGYTPHELSHGFRIKIPNNLLTNSIPYSYTDYARDIKENIREACKLAAEQLNNRKRRNKIEYDKNATNEEIEEGDLILTRKYVKENKFDDIFEGPFRVKQVRDGTITIFKGNKLVKVHKNFVKKTTAKYDKEPPLPFPIVELNEDELAEILTHHIQQSL